VGLGEQGKGGGVSDPSSLWWRVIEAALEIVAWLCVAFGLVQVARGNAIMTREVENLRDRVDAVERATKNPGA
jgi:hypothetical protein